MASRLHVLYNPIKGRGEIQLARCQMLAGISEAVLNSGCWDG